jgi:uncharacterized membrane protein YccC
MWLWFFVITAGTACGIVIGGIVLGLILSHWDQVVLIWLCFLCVLAIYVFFFTPWQRWINQAARWSPRTTQH